MSWGESRLGTRIAPLLGVGEAEPVAIRMGSEDAAFRKAVVTTRCWRHATQPATMAVTDRGGIAVPQAGGSGAIARSGIHPV
jgi:hypothetical protein